MYGTLTLNSSIVIGRCMFEPRQSRRDLMTYFVHQEFRLLTEAIWVSRVVYVFDPTLREGLLASYTLVLSTLQDGWFDNKLIKRFLFSYRQLRQT